MLAVKKYFFFVFYCLLPGVFISYLNLNFILKIRTHFTYVLGARTMFGCNKPLLLQETFACALNYVLVARNFCSVALTYVLVALTYGLVARKAKGKKGKRATGVFFFF